MLSEGDQFVWPGYDLRKVSGTDRFDYGYLPPKFFSQLLQAFLAWHKANKSAVKTRR